ncbi:MAG: division/cell wall cluster transcriptional repressor MraZ [bacterium]
MFVGQYNHNLDNKGRLAVPAKFRKELKKAVVTQGLDNCLVLYPQKEWQKVAQKFSSLPINKANNRAMSRFMLAGATEVEFDGQGRIILPEYLRKFAGLSKNVVIAGLYNYLEIWDEKDWNEYKAKTEKNSTDIAEALSDLNSSVSL